MAVNTGLIGINFKEETKYDIDEDFCGDIYLTFTDYGLDVFSNGNGVDYKDLINNCAFILGYNQFNGLYLYSVKEKPILLCHKDDNGMYIISSNKKEWWDDIMLLKDMPVFKNEAINIILTDNDIIIPKVSFNNGKQNLEELAGVKIEIKR
ncbi:MAG TPA: hypothetical protein VJJ23_03850 [Candidatus Nanoarchaeia archaeon]|nr:hypothetical protein [Candidatus Nanoarchaeia archaeon]